LLIKRVYFGSVHSGQMPVHSQAGHRELRKQCRVKLDMSTRIDRINPVFFVNRLP
jgi:hypothetical protein